MNLLIKYRYHIIISSTNINFMTKPPESPSQHPIQDSSNSTSNNQISSSNISSPQPAYTPRRLLLPNVLLKPYPSRLFKPPPQRQRIPHELYPPSSSRSQLWISSQDSSPPLHPHFPNRQTDQWYSGPVIIGEEEEPEKLKSALDLYPEASALLEMFGKGRASEQSIGSHYRTWSKEDA